MDSLLAIGIGIGLRLLVDEVSQHDFRVGGSLVGLWEGVVLYHFLEKMPRSRDPYLAYGVRLFIDFLVTESLYKMALVVLWTGLGLVLSDVAPFFWYDIGLRHVMRRFIRDMASLGVPFISLFFKTSSIPSRVRFHSPPRRSVAEEPQLAVPHSPRPPSVSPSTSTSTSTQAVTLVLPRVKFSGVPGSFPDDRSDVTRADSESQGVPQDYAETEDSRSSIMDLDNKSETNDSDSTSDVDPSSENPPDIPEEDEYLPDDYIDNDRTPTRRDRPLPGPDDSMRDAHEPDDTKSPPTSLPNAEFPVIPDGFGAEDEKVVSQDRILFHPDISIPRADDPITSDAPPIPDWRFPTSPARATDNTLSHLSADILLIPPKPSSGSSSGHAGDSSGSAHDVYPTIPPAVPPKDSPPYTSPTSAVVSISPTASVRQQISPSRTTTANSRSTADKANAETHTTLETQPSSTFGTTDTHSPEISSQGKQPLTEILEGDAGTNPPPIVGDGNSAQHPPPYEKLPDSTETQTNDVAQPTTETQTETETEWEKVEAPSKVAMQDSSPKDLKEEAKEQAPSNLNFPPTTPQVTKSTENGSTPSHITAESNKPKEQRLDCNNLQPQEAVQQLETALTEALKAESELRKLIVCYGDQKKGKGKGKTKNLILKLLNDRHIDYKETSKGFEIAIRPNAETIR